MEWLDDRPRWEQIEEKGKVGMICTCFVYNVW